MIKKQDLCVYPGGCKFKNFGHQPGWGGSSKIVKIRKMWYKNYLKL